MNGMKHKVYLDHHRIYICSTCHSHVLRHEDILSRSFQGQYGSAFLVCRVVNVGIDAKDRRMLLMGVHTVADIVCRGCHTKLGWKHLHEKNYIVEKSKLLKHDLF
ncbi:hypothetical protein EC973_008378 [Apophysomyces ossiformis]|uniref:Yippee domain-containing protein n=1 Tax=Apophysomyces ossiformis TaxID=679940 RepID=A0A8H7EPW8_9FUNG|nr:hypothetical protein EC973_008378 [Apophysomyces ossiformis]